VQDASAQVNNRVRVELFADSNIPENNYDVRVKSERPLANSIVAGLYRVLGVGESSGAVTASQAIAYSFISALLVFASADLLFFNANGSAIVCQWFSKHARQLKYAIKR
jgi:hypothetical protein